MKIRPLHDRVIVKRLEEEETTKGGIIIPDTAKEKPIEGKIVAVGAGKILENGKTQPLEVRYYCYSGINRFIAPLNTK
jgi:chaperonin GroES